ncbi:hypothetical protein BC828DRAFT_382936 [Blastocladiella britannica]|nr:hypothetical protein BC828DRAFT_382936 [Blastocladiella britannica]
MQRIRPLPTGTARHLHASVAIADPAQAVLQLAYNALDAGASLIRVTFDPIAFHLRISDNGHGIVREDMPLLGRNHASSRHGTERADRAPQMYGWRGQALAALAALAILDIVSRPSLEVPGSHLHLPMPPGLPVLSHSKPGTHVGTTVDCHNVFYNAPVRRRRWLPNALMTSVRGALEQLAVAHPQVAFTLVHGQTGRVLIDAPATGHGSIARLQHLAGKTAVPQKTGHGFAWDCRLPDSSTSIRVAGSWFETLHPQALIYINRVAAEGASLYRSVTARIERLAHSLSFGFVCFIECPRSVALDVDRLGAAVAGPRSSPRPNDRREQQADHETQGVSAMGLGLVRRARASQGFTDAPARPSTHPNPASLSTRHLGIYIDPRTGNSRYEAPRHWVDQGSDYVPLQGRLSLPRQQKQPPERRPATSPAVLTRTHHAHWSTAPSTLSITRSDLQSVRVLSQINCKFILGVVDRLPDPATSPKLGVIAIDQHAADERVRLEDLESAVRRNGLAIAPLVPAPVSVMLPRVVADKLRRHAEWVRWWGVFAECPSSSSSQDDPADAEVVVRGVPELAADRLGCDSAAIAAFVSDLVADLDPGRDPNDNTPVYSKVVIPRPVLALMHSKACRSAIMFGDPLDQQACRSLVHELGATAMPFQCAHGRPSIVPLLVASKAVATRPGGVRERARRQARDAWAAGGLWMPQ